jgi:hypothetical protein
MKKILKFWWVIVILIPVIITTCIMVSAKKIEESRKESFNYANKMVIPTLDDFNNPVVDLIKDGLTVVPPRYLKGIYDKQLYIRTVKGPITSIPEFRVIKELADNKAYYEELGGAFLGGFIIIRADSKYGEAVEVHEVGHAVDHILFKSISNSKEFIDLYNSEGKILFDQEAHKYFLQNTSEFFAEVFRTYYYSSRTRKFLKDRAPKTYKFMKELEHREFLV